MNGYKSWSINNVEEYLSCEAFIMSILETDLRVTYKKVVGQYNLKEIKGPIRNGVVYIIYNISIYAGVPIQG